ncbi:hypothetical protein QBC42DRAFT_277910 [Cladorrhinum samala]|uniref:Uncharacterized protein n=1 Tax=Cladorrhinum samala TaxID=585594 RepID=A0AAV9HBX5_9PEZI|nr:hypothetical protein QBC42DRAFT_277910 [Cladorrhinum samala]
MAIPRMLPAALGGVAVPPTVAVVAIHIILARSSKDRASSVRATAIVAAIFEGAVLLTIAILTYSHLGLWTERIRRFNGVWFGVGLLLCGVASAVSAASLICLSKVADDHFSTVLGNKAVDFLVGSSVALGIAFASQFLFLIMHFVFGRMRTSRANGSLGLAQRGNGSPPKVKSIAYHETNMTSISTKARRLSAEKTPPGSSAGRSTAETINSFRSSLSNVVRPVSSRTRLVSQRTSRRPPSLDLPSYHEPSRSTEDGFDSWDTSAVDPQNRQTVLESSSPPPMRRFLETIPDSPAPSRSPSPGLALDILEPPSRVKRRSRSYSPAPSRVSQSQRSAFTQHSTQSESHIHPLFRSDSPVQPSIITPGTIVVAAPLGGQILSDRDSIRSIRSIRRLRSGSLPTAPSPLSRQGSVESFHRKRESNSPEIREEDEDESVTQQQGLTPVVETERTMTPPIPDWVLTAGSRSSLVTYNSRKGRVPGDIESIGGSELN